MTRSTVVTALAFVLASSAFAAGPGIEFTDKEDPFTGDRKTLLAIESKNGQARMLFHCTTGTPPNVQFHFDSGTIFPDISDAAAGTMAVSVLHRLSSMESPQTSDWAMNFMKYRDAFFVGDRAGLLKEALESDQLAVRLIKNNSDHLFDLVNAKEELQTVADNCRGTK